MNIRSVDRWSGIFFKNPNEYNVGTVEPRSGIFFKNPALVHTYFAEQRLQFKEVAHT